MEKKPSLKKEVIQGIFGALVLISIFVFIGNRIAGAGHHEEKGGGEHAEVHDSKGPSPSDMRTFTVNAEKAKKGKADFVACAGCHGAEGEGKSGIAPRLNSTTFLAAASDAFLFNTIKNGRSGTTMIPWGGSFKDDQIENIVVYLRSSFKTEAATLDESPLKGNEEEGKKLYSDICSACHGSSGAGYQETANGTGIGRMGFLEKTTNGFVRYLAKHGKTGTAMKPMIGAKTAVSNLTETEIDSVIKYLRSQAW